MVGVVKIESDRDDYLLVTNGGILIRARAGDVSIYKRNTQGVKLINVGEGEQVVSLARYAESDVDDPDASDLSVVDVAEGDATEASEVEITDDVEPPTDE